MTTNGPFEDPVVMVARFPDSKKAKEAGSKVQEILDSAQGKVDSLFERQGGFADISDIRAIYARFGFRNDVGWTQEQPVITDGNEMIWEIPAGMVLEEAQVLLLSLGAEDITVQESDDEELWLQSFHPFAQILSDEEPDAAEPEKEFFKPMFSDKKILH